jgi:hypothetical protein
MDRIDKWEQMKQNAMKRDLEKFVRQIVRDEVEKLLDAKYDSENLLTVDDVKKKYRKSESTINRYIKEGKLNCMQSHAKGRRLFKKADCDAVFLKEKK